MSSPLPYVVHWAGPRFALAENQHGYLILAAGDGRQVQTFERSPAGWAQAFTTFTAYEPAPHPVERGGPNGTQEIPTPYTTPRAAVWYPYGPQLQPYQPLQPSGVGVAGGGAGIGGTGLSLLPPFW